MYFILTYVTVEDYVTKRAPFRSAHLALAMEYHDKGFLKMGGALADPADKAVLVFRCQDKSVIEDFVRQDPYVQNGLIVSWEVREWTVVIGGE
ncbi:YciI-like protein [Negadavirga shengliensis]|uniref:YciI-like protein n=1 Tax=Negadavirga shengliensis TaxID=1389218 RepID=A0ABV9T6I3_9BACT